MIYAFACSEDDDTIKNIILYVWYYLIIILRVNDSFGEVVVEKFTKFNKK